MNKEKYAQLERRRLLEVAREYRNRGYQVQIEPSDPPAFLQDLTPDLVALSEDDNVVVEIVSRESIGHRERLERLAESVEAMSGWRFELVVTNPQKQPTQDISLAEAKSRLSQAGQLKEQGALAAALLVAWSAAEAVLRQGATREGVDNTQLTPVRLVKTLYSLGILTRGEYERLEDAAEARNAAAHGYDPPEPLQIQRVLTELLGVADRLVRRIEPSPTTVQTEYTPEELADWFFENYKDPADGVPYDRGYLYVFGGPYDAWDELSAEFPDADEDVIQIAVEIIEQNGGEWVRRDQY